MVYDIIALAFLARLQNYDIMYHLDSCQTPISQLRAVISVYPDVTPDIGAQFLEL